MRNILLIGDSLTEQGYANQWCSKLQDFYKRRADVICRGLSGYNTRWVRRILEDPSQRDCLIPPAICGQTLFCTLFLGANDSVSNAYPQHVPIEEYEENLKVIARLINECVQPQYGVILITPPPIDPVKYLAYVRAERDATATESSRSLENTRLYRNAALAVASSLSFCSVVDLYAAFLGHESPERTCMPQQPWAHMFHDGLHFDANGGDVVFRALVAVLESNHDAVLPERLPMDLPHWSTLQ